MKAYSGRATLKQLPYLKPNYKGKNMSGGRQTYFKQSREYKRGEKRYDTFLPSGITQTASPWHDKGNMWRIEQ